MAFTRFATSEPWTRASGARINQLGDELEQQINVLNSKTYVSSGGGSSEYTTATKPSDYISDAFSVRKLRTCTAIGAGDYGYWASIVGLKGHGNGNCFELAFTSDGRIIYRKQSGSDDAWGTWQVITGQTIDLTSYLLNGWSNYSGGFETIRASKIGNLICVSGVIKGGTNTNGTNILQMPTGWRPSAVKICPHWLASGTMGRLDLASSGLLTINSESISNTFLQIDIKFII